jgi:putative YphP/YqiW family bacilliredoxin
MENININIRQMRDVVLELGAKELLTPDDVDATIPNSRGTLLVFVNSVCGCAARAAQPGLKEALDAPNHPDALVSVFAGQDREATTRAREYFQDEPPSSPSFALFRDGKFVHMIHRHQIQHHSYHDVARQLTEAFNKYCADKMPA